MKSRAFLHLFRETGRDRGRSTVIYLVGACTEKICATASLISRQRSGRVRSVRPARFACAPICIPRRRLHLPHSDCLKYLFTSSARGGAPLIIARANARSHPGRFTAHAFNPTTVPLHTRGYTRYAYISPVHKDR